MKQSTALLCIVLLSFCSCTNQENYDRKPVTKTVTGEVIKVSNLEGSSLVCLYDDYLLLRENRDTSLLIAYRFEDDSLKYVKGFINKERGPREFYYTEYPPDGTNWTSGKTIHYLNKIFTNLGAPFSSAVA